MVDTGAVRATTWVGEDGRFLRYERGGLVLVAVDEARARSLSPDD